MHELSIADSIIKIVLKEVQDKNLQKVKAIGVKIGALSGIFADALQFGFDAIKLDTILANTNLEIEEVAVSGLCTDCNNTFFVKDYIFECPTCKSVKIELQHGQEIDIAYLEIDDGVN